MWQSLSVPGKVYSNNNNNGSVQITVNETSEAQGGVITGWDCVDEIFSIRIIVIIEKMSSKESKVYVALMDLEKACSK